VWLTSKTLVIVDVQRDYFPGGNMPLHEPEAAAAKAGQVLEAFRAVEAALPQRDRRGGQAAGMRRSTSSSSIHISKATAR
jgi:nicotinamidase-related amidase